MTALTWDIRQGDALILLRAMPAESVHCLVTSPPYWTLRAYHAGPQEIGSEPTLEAYLAGLVAVFHEARRALHKTGVAWVNLGDTYVGASPVEGLQSGELCRIPDRVATALQQDGWLLRDCIVWAKSAPMPESVRGWFFAKHRIKIRQYEDMFCLWHSKGLRSVSQGQNMPCLRNGEGAGISQDGSLSSCEAPLSAKSEGEKDGTVQRGAIRCEGETPSFLGIGTGQKEQGEIRGQRKGKDCTQAGDCEVFANREGSKQPTAARPETEPESDPSSEDGGISQNLSSDRERANSQGQKECAKVCMGSTNRPSLDSSTVAPSSESESLSVLLLQREGQVDDRPRDASKQGGTAHDGKCSSSLPIMQQQEVRQDSDAFIDCPGCPQCTPNDGLVLRKGSWRTTRSHEYIFMLTKSREYFADGTDIRENATTMRPYPGRVQTGLYEGDGRNGYKLHKYALSSRNARSVWEIGPEPLIGEFAGQHFAAYPTALPERCIKAGTSAAGCCPRCLMPWARVVGQAIARGRTAETGYGNGELAVHARFGETARETLGFRPTCACGEAEPIPCIVLDPFSGTGSTGIAAIRNGRSYVGLELSAKYVELSKRRLSVEAPQANSVALACELGRELQLPMEGGDGH